MPPLTTKASTKILAFCWDTRSVASTYVQLINHFREHSINFYVVTNGPQADDIFTQNGIAAWQLKDIVEVTINQPSGLTSVQAQKIIEYDQIVGWQVLPVEMSPHSSQQMGKYYTWAAGRMVEAYRFLFRQIRPHIVFNWNGVAAMQAALTFVANETKVPCFFLERGLLPGTLVVDKEGVNYSSHVAGEKWHKLNATDLQQYELDALEQYCTQLVAEGASIVNAGNTINPCMVRKHLGISDDATVVLFPFQIEWDSNILLNSPTYKKMLEIIKDLQYIIRSMTNVVLIVKPHPEDRDRLAEIRSACTENCYVSTDLSINSLLDTADAVVTINSTVGLEALIRHKPVVTLGHSAYSEKGFTYDAFSKEALPAQLYAAISASKSGEFMTEKFERFLGYLLKHCLFRYSGEDPWNSRQIIFDKVFSSRSLKEIVESDIFVSLQEANRDKAYQYYKIEQENLERERAKNRSLQARIEELLNSASWKITAPARWLHEVICRTAK